MTLKSAVVGGGISGLTAAYRLSRLSPEDSLVLIERSHRTGGKVRSLSVEGFTFDEGPDSFLTRKPAGLALCEELGIADRLVGRNPEQRGSSIFRSNRLFPLPEGFTGLVPSDPTALEESGLLSREGVRRLQSPNMDEVDREESVAEYFTRRYGSEAFDSMLEPLVSGVFAGDARFLSLDAAFPHLSSRGRSKGAPLAGGRPGTPDSQSTFPPFVSFATGLGTLPESIESCIDPRALSLDTTVLEVTQRDGAFSILLDGGERIEAETVVLALPAGALAAVVSPLSPRLAEVHAEIESASTVIVNLGYRADELPNGIEGYGYLSPIADHRTFHGCTFASNKWPGRAPKGFAAIRLYGGRYGERELFESSDEAVLDAAQRELTDSLGLSARPVVSRVTRWRDAIPQYNLGYGGLQERVEEALRDIPGLFLAGAAYDGVGIPDCIRSGERAAADAAAYLKRTPKESR